MKPFHRMTSREFYDYCRNLFKALPPLAWADIQEGQMLVSGIYGYVVDRVPPKRGYLTVRNVLDKDNTPIRLSRRQHDDKMKPITPEFKRIMNLNHLIVVEEALKAGKEIPPIVQYDHPALFTPIPTIWPPAMVEKMEQAFSRLNEMRFFKDRQYEEGQWQLPRLDGCIAECRTDADKWRDHRAKIATATDPSDHAYVKPEFREDAMAKCDGLASEATAGIEIYEYLKRHCQKTLPQAMERASSFLIHR
jgi:hypothetical protein